MRNYILIALLASSVAMPAFAQDRGQSGRRDDDGESEQQSMQRPARAAPPQRVEREAPQAQREPRQAGERANWGERAEGRRRAAEQQGAQEPAFQQPALRQQGERRAWGQRRQERADAVQPQAYTPPADAADAGGERAYRNRGAYGAFGARDATGRERLSSGGASIEGGISGDGRRTATHPVGTSGQWSRDWRTRGPYDWRRHRDSHRSLFRLGSYRDPYRSHYRRFSIGFSLFPSYYQSNYWLDDPYMYRLPRVYGPYRWVRYYGDALLVNIYTGRVVDVVYDFFW